MNNTLTLTPELQQATDNLIQNLCASEPFLAYQQAQGRMNSDAPARALLERLAAFQAELRRKQTNSEITQADLEDLRALRAQVEANVTIMTYITSQQAAVNFLREINQEISQLLGVDFAILARQSTC